VRKTFWVAAPISSSNILFVALASLLVLFAIGWVALRTLAGTSALAGTAPPSLDLREPMAWAANAIPPRLDPAQAFRPFFLIQGKDSVPHTFGHMEWDVGDMTGRTVAAALFLCGLTFASPTYAADSWVTPAASLAGLIFAFAPYRFSHFMHMELQWAVWMPWAFWAMQRTLDTYGAERLELLRGPASVLYGQNGPGGLINYVSKRPTAEPQYEVEVGAGSFDRFEGRFDFSGPITEDGALQYRAIGLARDSDTQIDYVEADRIFFAPALTWEGEDTTLTLLAHYQRDDAGWGTQFLPASGTVLDNPNGEIPVSRFAGEADFDKYQLDQVAVGYQLEHRFNETFTVRQNARYAYIHNDSELVYGVGLNPADPQQRLLSRVGDESESELGSVAVDNQVQAKFDTGPVAHTALLGVDFQYYDFSDRGASRSVADLDIFDPDYGAELGDAVPYEDSDHMQRQIGIYAQEQAKLFDKLVVVLGGRYDFAKSESTEDVFNTESESEDSAFTGRAGLVYLFDNGLAPYASYSESFMPVLGTDAAGNPFKPEEGRQYEVGLKYQPPGWNSFVTVSLFELVKQNVLTPDPADPFNNQVQTGEIRSRGIELEGVASFDSGLDVTVAYTFLDAEITKSNAESDSGESELGNRPERTAKHSASLWADYTIPQGDFAGLGAGAGVRYIGPTFGDNFEELKLPGYTLFDASVHYDWNSFRFQLNGSNLADKAYVASCYGETSCFYGERRAVIGTVTYSW
jgi:iron complex outermembrane receptor protein